MKFLVVFACMILLVSSGELREQVNNAISQTKTEESIETCMNENNITKNDWFLEDEIMTDFYTKPENAEKKRTIGCTVTCFLKKLDFMDASNNLNEAKVHLEISTEYGDNRMARRMHRVARDCMKEAKPITEKCDKGFTLYACLSRAIHKIWRGEDHERDENEAENNTEETENNTEINGETNNAQE